MKNQTTTIEDKRAALAGFLGIDVDDVCDGYYSANTFEAGGGEYIVATDEEADAAARECIAESLWAFRPEFLEIYVPNGMGADMLKIIQEASCENCNGAIRAMVDIGPQGFDALVEDAIGADGRGHFLASYDHEENKAGGLFIYRVN